MTNPSKQPVPTDFTLISRDTIRYGDTDRQGHVNNAVFSTFLETGRVDFLYNMAPGLREPGAAFVIARLELDFRGEINWPGEVEIGTALESVGRSSIRLRQAIFVQGHCVAEAKSVLVQMDDTTRRARPFAAEVAERLREFASEASPAPA